jgi:cellulose synthase/poly-beta-1,6-N-acetylglucosamine synthase-like glycosyltransferase
MKDEGGRVEPVSVIIITRNEEGNIRGCLETLLAQDFPRDGYEVIVVDASSDATPEIAASYEGVRVVRSAEGFSAQKNAGVARARFDILAFSDADCLFPPDWLAVIARTFRRPELAAAGGNAYPPPGTSGFGLWSACVGHPGGGAIGFDANVTPGPEGVAFAPGCNSVYRRSAIRAVGGFDPDFEAGGEDVDISRRMRARGLLIDYVPDLNVYHKPRTTLRSYFRWNVSVGVTKWNLKRPGPARILLNPFFPAWSFGLALGLLALPRFPWLTIGAGAGVWALFVLGLALGTRPYPLLWRRRRRIGVSVAAVLAVVPALVYVRQVGISLGEWKMQRASRSARRSRR